MIGTPVEHPQYGPRSGSRCLQTGQRVVSAVLRAACVSGDPGRSLRGSTPTPRPSSRLVLIKSTCPQISTPQVSPPMLEDQFGARGLIEALRLGIAPAQQAQALTIGLEKERASLVAGLESAQQGHGAVRAVVGDYGQGKSHVVELTAQAALERNFLVASSSLDLLELPPHRGFDIYASLAQKPSLPG